MRRFLISGVLKVTSHKTSILANLPPEQVFNKIGKFDIALDVSTPSSDRGDIEIFQRLVKNGHSRVYEPAILVWHKCRPSKSQAQAKKVAAMPLNNS